MYSADKSTADLNSPYIEYKKERDFPLFFVEIFCTGSTAALLRFKDKAVAIAIVDIIEDLSVGKTLYCCIHHNFQAIKLNHIFLFRLFQSQAQFGPASAKALKQYPEKLALILRQYRLQGKHSCICNFHFVLLFHNYIYHFLYVCNYFMTIRA